MEIVLPFCNGNLHKINISTNNELLSISLGFPQMIVCRQQPSSQLLRLSKFHLITTQHLFQFANFIFCFGMFYLKMRREVSSLLGLSCNEMPKSSSHYTKNCAEE